MKRLIFRTGSGFNVKLKVQAPAAILTKTTLKCSWRLVQSPNDVLLGDSNSNWISMSFPKNFCPKFTCAKIQTQFSTFFTNKIAECQSSPKTKKLWSLLTFVEWNTMLGDGSK